MILINIMFHFAFRTNPSDSDVDIFQCKVTFTFPNSAFNFLPFWHEKYHRIALNPSDCDIVIDDVEARCK